MTTSLQAIAAAPMSPEGHARLRKVAERYVRDEIKEDLDYENWGQLVSPMDVLSLLDECHGRRFDPNLVAEIQRLRARVAVLEGAP